MGTPDEVLDSPGLGSLRLERMVQGQGFPWTPFLWRRQWEEAGWVLGASPLGCFMPEVTAGTELFPQTSTLCSVCDLGQVSSPALVSLAGQ